MICPGCRQSTIGFVRWCFGSWGFDSYFWTCPHCGARLRCNRSVTIWSVVSCLALLSWLAISIWTVYPMVLPSAIENISFGTLLGTLLALGLMLVAFCLPLSYLSYRAGGYIVREKGPEVWNENDKARFRTKKRRRWLFMTAGVFLAATIVGVPVGIYGVKREQKAALACYERGAARYRNHEYDQAIADFTKAIQLSPKFLGAYNARGFCYVDTGEYDKALADSNDALRIKPKNVVSYWLRGYAYCAQGYFDHAIAELTRAIELQPKVAGQYADRAYAYGRKGEHDKVIADLTVAIRLRPEIAQYYADRGNTYFFKGEFVKAFADFDKAMRLEKEADNSDQKEP